MSAEEIMAAKIAEVINLFHYFKQQNNPITMI